METEAQRIARFLEAGGAVSIDEELCHCGAPEKSVEHTDAEACACAWPDEHHPFALTTVTLRVRVR